MMLRWNAHHIAPEHALPLERVLDLLAVGDEHQTVRGMLELLRSTIAAGSATAIEHVLQGGALEVREVVSDPGASGAAYGAMADDPAHRYLSALARGSEDDAVIGLLGPADSAGSGERVSVLYTLAPNTAWALHFLPAEPAVGFVHEVLSLLPATALFVREVHRIVSPTAAPPGARTDAAAVRLSLRAASLSGREREICARIAGGRSTTAIAAELGIATSTVMTLRKRAYAKLGIHDRLDLRHLAA